MGRAAAVGAVAIVAIILVALGTYYVASTPLQASIFSYQSVVESMSADPSTTTVYSEIIQSAASTSNITTTSFATETTTSVSVSTSTITAFPIAENVSVAFQNSGASFNYNIRAPTFSYSGSSASNSLVIGLTPVYTGEQITVTASCGSSCPSGFTLTATLNVNGSVVSQSTATAYSGLTISSAI